MGHRITSYNVCYTKLLRIVICLAFQAGTSRGDSLNSVPGKDKKLNVLLIYTDDHRYSGVHALAGMQVRNNFV